MSGIRVIVMLAVILGVLLIAGISSANAATAKPAVAHPVQMTRLSYGSHVLTPVASLAAIDSDYPYSIYATEVKISSTTVGTNTGALDVCLQWNNPSAILYLKIFDPAGNQISFELSDGRVVSEVGDADDGAIDHAIHFVVSNDDASNLMQGNWYYEVRSDSRSAMTKYRI